MHTGNEALAEEETKEMTSQAEEAMNMTGARCTQKGLFLCS